MNDGCDPVGVGEKIWTPRASQPWALGRNPVGIGQGALMCAPPGRHGALAGDAFKKGADLTIDTKPGEGERNTLVFAPLMGQASESTTGMTAPRNGKTPGEGTRPTALNQRRNDRFPYAKHALMNLPSLKRGQA
jgi:hypothetical protein